MSVLNSKAASYAALGLVVVAAVYFIGRRTAGAVKDAASAVVDAVENVNAGTPYEGAGIVGTIGHATDALSGGLLSRFGQWLGGKLYEWTHPEWNAQAPISVDADERGWFTGE